MTLAAAAALLVAACGGSATPAESAPTGTLNVTIGQSIVGLQNTGIYLAQEKGFFTDQKLNVTITTLQSGTVATQALASGTVDVVGSGPFDIAAGATKGLQFYSIANLTGVSLEVCASKRLVQSKGLTASSTPAQVMAAFKGTTMGITGANSAPDLVLRFMIQKYGGLKPDTDVKISALGTVPAELTALQRGLIDGFLQSPPACEQAQQSGAGVPILRASNAPDLKDMPFAGLVTMKPYATSHKDLMTRLATAVAKGNDFARDHPDDALAILQQKYFPTVDPAVLKDAFTNVNLPVIAKDAKTTSAGWAKVSSLLVASGAIDKPLDTKEGVLWTNSYIHL